MKLKTWHYLIGIIGTLLGGSGILGIYNFFYPDKPEVIANCTGANVEAPKIEFDEVKKLFEDLISPDSLKNVLISTVNKLEDDEIKNISSKLNSLSFQNFQLLTKYSSNFRSSITCEISNIGSKNAVNVEFYLPELAQSVVINKVNSGKRGEKKVELGTLKPNLKTELTLWFEWSQVFIEDNYQISYDDGVGKVRFSQPVFGTLAGILKLPWQPWIYLFAVLIITIVSYIPYFIFLKKKQNKSFLEN